MNSLKTLIIISLLITFSTDGFAQNEHDHEESVKNHQAQNDSDEAVEENGHEESAEITLTKDQQKLAGIQIKVLKKRNLNYKLYAPGELQTNGYKSYLVSPRTNSVVMKRHKALGDHVKQGDDLVTLFSESVAEAQATLKIASAEWQRVQQLGRKVVGDSRYVTTKNDYELAKARLIAFGLSEDFINENSSFLGEYTLNAEIDGAILSDDFQQGQRVEAGHALMLLSDESQLWVEARVQASKQLDLPVGTLAQVKVGDQFYTARISQEAHTIDEKTRTRVIRLLIDNPEDTIHPGQFADVYFNVSTDQAVTIVPENALMRTADGDWAVFVETEDNQFIEQEVELGRVLGDFHEIFGLEIGTKVVTQGAFFVASEIAKGGFDPHGH
ncbi:MAG: efflux RND transporter periplasmic adaptor subunit [Proteobacteria bacterium]|nr:MAG: efflux RND transporter periplasmic adaptor subunit [Pseudomonadota bacterium]